LKVKAEEATTAKTRNLLVRKPTGELFQDGKPVYQITAQRTIQDGKQLFLRVKL